MTNSVLAAAAESDSLFGDLSDVFDSRAFSVAQNLALFFVVVFWIAVAFWVFKDARRRIEDGWFVAMATVLGLLLPFLGAFIYMLFRPPEYLEDVRERELEIKAMEERLAVRDLHCPVCRAEVGADFLVCPVCTTRLKQACDNCKAPLEALWQVCPYCETPVVGAPAFNMEATMETPRRRRRRE